MRQNIADALQDEFGIYSIQIFREYHEARNSTELTLFFRDAEGRKHRVEVWFAGRELIEAKNIEEYTAAALKEAIRKELES